MGAHLVQRGIVAVLVAASVGAALAVHLTSTRHLNDRRARDLATTRERVADAVARRTYYLEDVADMVGVHDDAAAEEFSRYSHVRGRDEHSVVAVQWVRHSPKGKLVPPDPADPEPGATPMLITPAIAGDRALARAARQSAATPAIRVASVRKDVAVSAPVTLASGHPGFYLAVPVQGRRYSGLLSNRESQSAIVGLVDAQTLVEDALGGANTPLRLRDRATPLAGIGSSLDNAMAAALPVAGRRWTISVAGGALAPFLVALPWLILAFGCGLATAVGLILRGASRRRDEALRLADKRLADLQAAHAQAEMRSRVDELTEIFNRRHFSEELEKELARNRSGRTAVLMLDIDHFKEINDEHGHGIGDIVLRAVAGRIASIMRSSDCLARWGGEEFAILARDMNRQAMVELAERARRALGDNPIVVEGVRFHLRVSVGAALTGEGLDSADAAIDAADKALYEAKRTGRDRVRVYAPPAGAHV
jgi:diguanylate cyclase (GGDEF)-like protein